MGYYSYYSFWEESIPGDYDPLSKEVMDFISENDIDYCDLSFAISDRSKFYDCNEVMKKLSKNFPNKLFKVYREGEGSSDMEESYYKDGKMASYEVEIRFQEFNPSDLK